MTYSVSVGDIIPFCGMICFTCSLYPKMPDCIGFSASHECLCLQSKFFGCKPSKEAETWFLCLEGKSTVNPIHTLYLGTHQCFCIDHRCGIPLNSAVPNVITIAFCTLFHNNKSSMKFFKKVSEL